MTTDNLLYIDLAEFENGQALRGGALVIDLSTEPLEFRCTDAVRPTTIQRILWGARLNGQLAVNVLAMPLVRALRQQYCAVVTRGPDFLGLREFLDLPVVCVRKHSDVPFLGPEQSGESVPDNAGQNSNDEDIQGDDPVHAERLLTNPAGHFEPLILECHREHKDDLQEVRPMLARVFATRDVLEPFDRIATALEAIQEQTAKDRKE